MAPAPLDEKTLRLFAAQAGQEHVFRFWNDLPADGRRKLLEQVAELDFEELSALVSEHITHRRPVELPADLGPAPFVPLPRTDEARAERRRMHERGEELLRAGKVAAFVVAGGQGTRLGFDGPKGTFPVGPVSRRTLFQVFAEAILAARRAYGVPIPWYIMTSRANDRQTRDFFEAHNFFNLPRGDVKFFTQGRMPAVDLAGKLILAAKDELAWNPDGHGGSIRALARSGMLTDMAARGVEHISYFQVDNPLVPPIDPVFLGNHAETGSEMSSKMARKRDPLERVGAFCVSHGRLYVIEYSDLPSVLAHQQNPDGTLRFEAGSIAIHILARRFVERLSEGKRFGLPFHRAEKQIPCIDEAGRPVSPAEPNGIKFETFVFDALPLAQRTMILEIDRACEFSPVKNPDGEDSIVTAHRDMVRLAARWFEEAGVRLPRDAAGEPQVKVEISALAARNVEELRALVAQRRLRRIDSDLYLGPDAA
jgi:UDP-N-acetylglucosamine/UDP-N-acetylgalactosamine diphosphorylase